LRNNLYEAYYFNFLSAIPRPLLEELAQASVESGTSHQVARVVDQYLGFVSLSGNLFTLSQPDVYLTLNNPKTQDSEVEGMVEKIANSLFSVVLTLGEIPIIRCPSGNAAEMVAQKLDQKIRQHVSNPKTNLFQDSDPTNFQRQGIRLRIVDCSGELWLTMFSSSSHYFGPECGPEDNAGARLGLSAPSP